MFWNLRYVRLMIAVSPLRGDSWGFSEKSANRRLPNSHYRTHWCGRGVRVRILLWQVGSPRFIRSAADVVRQCGRGVLSVVYAQQTVGEISVVSVIKGWPLRGGTPHFFTLYWVPRVMVFPFGLGLGFKPSNTQNLKLVTRFGPPPPQIPFQIYFPDYIFLEQLKVCVYHNVSTTLGKNTFHHT